MGNKDLDEKTISGMLNLGFKRDFTSDDVFDRLPGRIILPLEMKVTIDSGIIDIWKSEINNRYICRCESVHVVADDSMRGAIAKMYIYLYENNWI